jgi:hypothetical protein
VDIIQFLNNANSLLTLTMHVMLSGYQALLRRANTNSDCSICNVGEPEANYGLRSIYIELYLLTTLAEWTD